MFIDIKGAQEHNLKNIDISIPKNTLVAFTGVSGSGKSSLVFDTIYKEALRRFVDASAIPIYFMGNSVWAKLSRPRFTSITGLPPALGLSQKQGVVSKLSTVGTITGIADLLRVYYAAFGDVYCKNCDVPLRATPFEALLNNILTQFNNEKVFFIAPIAEKRKGSFTKEIEKFRDLGFSKLKVNGENFDLQDDTVKVKIDAKKLNTIEIIVDCLTITADKKTRITRALVQALEYGKGLLKLEINNSIYKFNTSSACPQCHESAPKLDPRYFSHSSLGQCTTCLGVGARFETLPLDLFPCPECKGSRLTLNKPIVRICSKTYEELQSLSLSHLNNFVLQNLVPYVNKDVAKNKIVGEMSRLLSTIQHLHLDHVTLNRSGATLAPGDLQRLRLASIISNKLTGALYVVDEPCQGLTSQEVLSLVNIFNDIVKYNASVIAVEHHPTFLQACPVVFTMGPGAGLHGGLIVDPVVSPIGSPQEDALSPRGLTAGSTPHLYFTNINIRNTLYKNMRIYQGKINILHGPSGSGKASFINLCLLPCLWQQGAKFVDTAPETQVDYSNFFRVTLSQGLNASTVCYLKPGSMQRTSRRIVAAALEVLPLLRSLFASLPQSQVMGLTENHFSWNSKLGQCPTCLGRGYVELPQKYAQPLRLECEACLGAKLHSRALTPRFKGYSFFDFMNLTLEQVKEIMSNHKYIASKLFPACQFGLGYVMLGQGMDTLSGGELQRLTLTMELKRSHLEGVWFILSHPSTGLHKPDIEVLGNLMVEMTHKGASFVAVENREEFLHFSGVHAIQMG